MAKTDDEPKRKPIRVSPAGLITIASAMEAIAKHYRDCADLMKARAMVDAEVEGVPTLFRGLKYLRNGAKNTLDAIAAVKRPDSLEVAPELEELISDLFADMPRISEAIEETLRLDAKEAVNESPQVKAHDKKKQKRGG